METVGYDAFGKTRIVNGTVDATFGASSTEPRGYINQEMLPEAQLIDLNAQYFDPFQAKFLAPEAVIGTVANQYSVNAFFCLPCQRLSHLRANQEWIKLRIIHSEQLRMRTQQAEQHIRHSIQPGRFGGHVPRVQGVGSNVKGFVDKLETDNRGANGLGIPGTEGRRKYNSDNEANWRASVSQTYGSVISRLPSYLEGNK